MDAVSKRKRRDTILRRESVRRWSMNSQRLEEIVAVLMKPISDSRRSFDTDLSALLEEYLTEAGLHALEEDLEDSPSQTPLPVVAPNFAELALLLQQSASIYGRKVDFLYQHVLEVSETLQNHVEQTQAAQSDEPTQTPSKRKRKSSVHAATEFTTIDLEPCPSARKEAEVRPPPTLPRLYLELEPPQPAEGDLTLTDYNGESIGLLQDFQVTWRLQDGFLVDELAMGIEHENRPLRPLPLSELQAALQAAAPPDRCIRSPSVCATVDLHNDSGISDETPDSKVSDMSLMPPPNVVKKERKRKSDLKIDELLCSGCFTLSLTKQLRRKLRKCVDFTVDSEWINVVVKARRKLLLDVRSSLLSEKEFLGFDMSDTGGFLGWSTAEVEEATQKAKDSLDLSTRLSQRLSADMDSEDDGFFEQSSTTESDTSRVDDSQTVLHNSLSLITSADLWSWQAGIVKRAEEAERNGGVDVRSLGQTIIGQLNTGSRKPFDDVLTSTASCDTDVSRLFLSTLFLANAGNVEIIQGAPLSLNSFSVQLKSTDERLYCSAVAADQEFLR